jgi:hypothetical protein
MGYSFVGIFVATVALYGFLYGGRMRLLVPTLLVGIIFAIDGMGDATPVHRLLYSIPVLGSVRYPSAKLIFLIWCFSLTFMFGLWALINEQLTKKQQYRFVSIAAFWSLLLIIGWYGGMRRSPLLDEALNLLVLIILPLFAVYLIPFAARIGSSPLRAVVVISIASVGILYSHVALGPSKFVNLTQKASFDCESVRQTWRDARLLAQRVDGSIRVVPDFKATENSEGLRCSQVSNPGQLLNIVAMAGLGVPSVSFSPRHFGEFRTWYPKAPVVGQRYLEKVGAQHLTEASEDVGYERFASSESPECNLHVGEVNFVRPDQIELNVSVHAKEVCEILVRIPDDGYLVIHGARRLPPKKREDPLRLLIEPGEREIVISHEIPGWSLVALLYLVAIVGAVFVILGVAYAKIRNR